MTRFIIARKPTTIKSRGHDHAHRDVALAFGMWDGRGAEATRSRACAHDGAQLVEWLVPAFRHIVFFHPELEVPLDPVLDAHDDAAWAGWLAAPVRP